MACLESSYSWTPQGEHSLSQVNSLLLPCSWGSLCLPSHMRSSHIQTQEPNSHLWSFTNLFSPLFFVFLSFLSSHFTGPHASAKSFGWFLRRSPDKITLGEHPLISTSSKPPPKRRVSTACSKHAMYGLQPIIKTQNDISRCGKISQVLDWSWQPPYKRPVLITHQLRTQFHFARGTEGAERLAVELVHHSAIKATVQPHAQKQSILPLDSPNLSAAWQLQQQGGPSSTLLNWPQCSKTWGRD